MRTEIAVVFLQMRERLVSTGEFMRSIVAQQYQC